MSRDPRDVTGMLLAWGDGDRAVESRLIAVLYQDLRRVARRRLRAERADHSFSPTARTVAGVHLERDKYVRGVCRIVSSDRIQAADFDASGFEPHWRRDGKELFYMAPNQMLMAIAVKAGPTTLEVSPPKALFPTRIKWMEIQAVAHH